MSGGAVTLTFLGTGSSIPPHGRQQVSFCLRHDGGLVIFDCGEGTQYALRENKISTRKELIVCISHLHSDHFLGLPGLLSSFELLNREEKVTIIGPHGILRTVKSLIKANYVKFSYPLEIVEIEEGGEYRGNDFTIKCVEAVHEANALSLIWKEDDKPGKMDIQKIRELGIPEGPLIGKLQRGESIHFQNQVIKSEDVQGPAIPGRVVVYSGDTSYNPTLIEKIPIKCDILVHEGTYPSDYDQLAHERGHSTTLDAAKVAKESKVDRLIITHISPRITDLKAELLIVKKYFSNSEFAQEGQEIILPYPKEDQ